MSSARARTISFTRQLLLLLLLALGACSAQQQKLPESAIASASTASAERETTIALLGGTGFAGGYILREALARGYPVRALSRTTGRLDYLGPRVTEVQGDARDPAALARLLTGADIVVSAIGPPRAGGDSRSGLNSAVTEGLIDAMRAAGLRRYILVSGAAVGELAAHFLEKHGIMIVKVASKFDLRRLCKATPSVPR